MTEAIYVVVTARLQNGHAQLEERFEVQAESLQETLAILSRFHDLSEQIRDEQANVKGKG